MTQTRRAAAGALALLALLVPSRAQEARAQERPVLGPPPVLSVGAAESSASRKIELTAGRSVIVDLPRDAKEVFVANPAVANAVVRSTRKVFVIGMVDGATSIFILDADGRQIAALDVTVARDLKLGTLRQLLGQSIPGGRFDVRVTGDSILLTGSVGSSSEAQQAIDIANAFVGVSGGGAAGATPVGAATRGAVINNLTIRNRDQVMLRVTVVEVARTVLKQFGINLNGSWSGLNLANATPFALSAGQFPNANLLSGTVNGTGGASLTATLRAFEQAGVSRVLAEPTLTAISGEAAKFTAGGQIPVPSNLSCSTTGTIQSCTPSIAFKDYGVSLSFTPVVLSENRISVRVGTEVIEIDQQNSLNINISGTTTAIPGFTSRKSETTIELASGATMMTAGLIQQRSKAAISGLPGLVNLPILGALFRSRDYQRQETELMIMVTPFIAKAMEPRQTTRPDDGFADATDGQGILLGRLNRIYGTAGAAPLGRGYRGRVGFITD